MSEATKLEIKLNLGAGDMPMQGYINLDRKTGSEVYPLRFDTGVVDEVRASHILEHFGTNEVPAVLAEWARVLRPGGRIRIAVPDMKKIELGTPLWDSFIMGGQQHADDFHKSCYTRAKLAALLEAAGFTDITDWKSEINDCAAYPISLNLQGIKSAAAPAPAGHADIKIIAVTSVPRLGWQDHFSCQMEALHAFGIPLVWFTGAFWEQGMQNALLEARDKGVDWIIASDYDTLFTKEDLDRLFAHFGNNPDIDALAALQRKRACGPPLFAIKGQKDDLIQITGAPLKVSTAHFGLTLIRAAALKDFPLPWFHGTPAPDGTWTHPDAIHPDIYFWKKWEEHGRSVYVAPDVRVGHLELMVSEFDEAMQPRHITAGAWRERNRKK